MKEHLIENRLTEVERELAVTGDDLLETKRVFRASIDALALEIRALWQCLHMLHSDQKEKIDRLKENVLRETDPEKSSKTDQ